MKPAPMAVHMLGLLREKGELVVGVILGISPPFSPLFTCPQIYSFTFARSGSFLFLCYRIIGPEPFQQSYEKRTQVRTYI